MLMSTDVSVASSDVDIGNLILDELLDKAVTGEDKSKLQRCFQKGHAARAAARIARPGTADPDNGPGAGRAP
jgi:hypothetical protein